MMYNYWVIGVLVLLVLLVVAFVMHKNSSYKAPTTAPTTMLGKLENWVNEHK